MELSRKKQIKRRQLPGFDDGKDYIDYVYQALYNPYVGITNSLNNRIDPSIYNQIRDKFNQQSAVNKYTVPLDENAKNIGPWFALGSWVGSGIAKGIGAIEQPDLLITNAGTTNGSVGGIGYTKYNTINQNLIMDDYDKTTALSFLTNPFEGITRLFGRNKQKELARNAAILTLNLNIANRTGAQTQALLLDYNLKYGNPSNQVLYAAKGKDEGVYTADGIFNMMPNALGQRNEALMENLDPEHPENASATVIKDGKGGVDDVPLSVKPDTKIGGNDIDWNTGISFKKEILPFATILEHMKKKYYNNLNNLSSLSKPTQRVQLNEANKVLSDVVKNLKAYTDLLKWQHDITGYNQPMIAARGKDRTIPPLFPSAATQLLMDYLTTRYDRWVNNRDDEFDMRNYYRNDYRAFTVPGAEEEYGKEAVDEAKSFANEKDYVDYFMNQYNEKKKKRGENLQKRLDSNPWSKLNKHAEGKDYHTIPNVLGALISIGLIIDASKQKIKTSDSYVPTSTKGINTLAGLRINPYPIMRQVRDALSQADYALNNSGGLSGALKYLGRLANANNVYTNYAKLLSDIVTQNNQYAAQYANAFNTLDMLNATRRQNANQWDLDYYSKAHAARLGGVLMGIRNLMDYINHWSSDASKLNQFNKMYNLYAVDTYSRANKAIG